jgi:hypothetical protein
VSLALGGPLALGALAGAAAGAAAAHVDGLALVGRVLLGCVLVAQAARFARDGWRARG